VIELQLICELDQSCMEYISSWTLCCLDWWFVTQEADISTRPPMPCTASYSWRFVSTKLFSVDCIFCVSCFFMLCKQYFACQRILPRNAMQAGYMLSLCVCVWLSVWVCVSVTLWYVIKIAKRRITQNDTQYPRDSSFLVPKIATKFDQGLPLLGR